MSTMVVDSTIGLEDVQREVSIVLMDHLNAALAAIAAKWESKDEALADKLGTAFTPTVLEAIPMSHFYEGHVPSLINAPVDRYPNVATMVFRGAPDAASELFDHANRYADSLVIDVMVRSDASEQEVNRRAHRTAEAVNLCIQSYPTLYGVSEGAITGPTVELSDVFVRKEKTRGHYGAEWFWQGARLSYGVRKTAPVATSTNGFMRSAGLDQA